MALVPRPKASLFDPNAQVGIDMVPSSEPAPSADATISAAFRQENVIGSLMSMEVAGGAPDPDYNAWDSIKGTAYEPYWDKFDEVRNAGQDAAKKRQIDREAEDRRTIAAAGGWGVVATLGAGLLSPENLMPAGTIYRGIKTGSTIARSVMSTASAAVISTAAAEQMLRGSQVLRTPEESLFNIGGAAIVGGLIGGGASALFRRSDFSRLTESYASEAEQAVENTAQSTNEEGIARSLGAASLPVATLDENTIAGRMAQIAGGVVQNLNPVLRVLHSPSTVVRDLGTRLFENPIYLKKNMGGVASQPAAETLVKEYTQGALSSAIDDTNKIFSEYRKTPGGLSREEFNKAIGRAMRRDDKNADPSITKAAQAWRKTVFDPLKEKAIEAGLLPKDVSVDTALSYFTRVYNKPMMLARETEFKNIVRAYIWQEVRNAELRAEMANLDPKVQPPATEPIGFLSAADRQGYVDQITDDIFNTITGKNADADIPRDIVPATRGPLKERTFHIPDVLIEQFLEDNVEAVGRRYARSMSSDIELTNAFGSADMKDAIRSIREDYAKLRAQIDAAPAEGHPAPTLAQTERLRSELNVRERNDVQDVEALRDLLRGTYLRQENSTNYARVARVAGTLNYLRTMGGVTLSSAADIARHVMVHGFGNVMNDGLRPLITNLKGFRMAVEEARLAGAISERLLNTRMATWADINDPYRVSSPFERFMENTANGFSKLNGLVYWNDFQKAFASVVTQNRILRGALKYGELDPRETAYLAYLGIDRDMAERITEQMAKHGTLEEGGVRVAHTSNWDDTPEAQWAKRVYRAAINKDVDSTIISKGIGDIPLFMNTPTGRLAMQFKGFALASHQRALMRGLQERPLGFLSGTLTATAIGMMIYYLKSVESNRMEDISDNPGRWIAEGLDRSGIFSIAFEANNTIEKAFGIGAYGALAAMFPDSEQSGKASRYLNRPLSSVALGPTGDLVDTLVRAGNAIKGSGDGWTQGDINSVKKLIPGVTLPGIRSLVEYAGMPAIKSGAGIGVD